MADRVAGAGAGANGRGGGGDGVDADRLEELRLELVDVEAGDRAVSRVATLSQLTLSLLSNLLCILAKVDLTIDRSSGRSTCCLGPASRPGDDPPPWRRLFWPVSGFG